MSQILKLEQVCFDVLRENGGADRDRTDDILLAKQALSQLSYAPFWEIVSIEITLRRRLLPAILERAGRATWWAREDLNLRPHAYQARALTS